MLNITGSMVALITPMQNDVVDLEGLARMVEWHIQNGTDGIVVLGTTGENATLSAEEQEAVCRTAVEAAAGRIPIIAGSGTNNTAHMLERSLCYEKLGADGLLLIAPYYNKANEEGMYRHFTAVADRVRIPCLLYNVPGRTGCSIPVPVVERLAAHPNIIGIKEASGDLSYATKIARFLGPDFVMYSGNDDIVLPMLALGASGVISVFANICPKEAHRMVQSYMEGNAEECRRIQLDYLDVINALFYEVNPIPVKAAMNMLGMGAGTLRLPLYQMSAPAAARLRTALEKAGLL